MLPLHRSVVWQKANEALSNLRGRMAAAGLDPSHVTGSIVYIEEAAPDEPRLIDMEYGFETTDQRRAAVFEQLGRDDVIAIGMIFTQIDWHGGTDGGRADAYFPYQFTGLSERGMAALKAAATKEYIANGPNIQVVTKEN